MIIDEVPLRALVERLIAQLDAANALAAEILDALNARPASPVTFYPDFPVRDRPNLTVVKDNA